MRGDASYLVFSQRMQRTSNLYVCQGRSVVVLCQPFRDSPAFIHVPIARTNLQEENSNYADRRNRKKEDGEEWGEKKQRAS